MNYLMVIAIVLASFFSSCEKNNNSDDNKTLKLTKIHWNNEENGSYELNVTYNDNGKITGFHEVQNETETSSIITYNSDGKVEKEVISQNGETIAIDSFSYQTDTIIVKNFRKFESEELYESSRFKYILNEQNQVIKILLELNIADNWYEGAYSLNTWTNDNLTKTEQYSVFFGISRKSIDLYSRKFIGYSSAFNKSGLNDSELSSTVTYEYDDKKNPYKDIFDAFPSYSTGINNVTKMTITLNGEESAPEVSNHTYEYNKDNYPTKETSTYIKDGEEITEVQYFEYE